MAYLVIRAVSISCRERKSVLLAQYYNTLIYTAQKCYLVLHLLGKTEYWQDYKDVTMLFSSPIYEINLKNKTKPPMLNPWQDQGFSWVILELQYNVAYKRPTNEIFSINLCAEFYFIQSLLSEAVLHDIRLKTKTGNKQNKEFCMLSQNFMQLSPHMGNQQPNKTHTHPPTHTHPAKATHKDHPSENKIKYNTDFHMGKIQI